MNDNKNHIKLLSAVFERTKEDFIIIKIKESSFKMLSFFSDILAGPEKSAEENDLISDTSGIEIFASVKLHEPDIFARTVESLYNGANLNLVNCDLAGNPLDYKIVNNSLFIDIFCEIIIVEPEFLIDISSIAECFKDHGAHHLNYFINRLSTDVNSPPLILGNIANQFLDDILNETDEEPAQYKISMAKSFANYPLAIASCAELNDERKQREFFSSASSQFENIRNTIRKDFAHFEIDREKSLIEPSFICVALGLQGRLDMLQEDYKKFIELKSGKAVERYSENRFSYKENNYVQMLLYYAVLNINMGLEIKEIDAFLFYSKYPVLLQLPFDHRLVKKALNIRNLIVTTEREINDHNNPDFTETVISSINSSTLNVNKDNSSLWNKFIKPRIDNFSSSIAALSLLERKYFFSLFTFITKEQFVSKTGDFADEMNRGITMLWNSTVKEKSEAGEIITPLKITEAYPEHDHHIIKFALPKPSIDSIPNFRKGDAVIFYQQKDERSNVCNSQVLKASIEHISATEVIASLRFIQRNESVLPLDAVYTIERDYLDASYNIMYKGLAQFVEATQERRSLLLGQRMPGALKPLKETHESDIDRIVDKAASAKDFFLLVGPPGTGKTSVALRGMIKEFYSDPDKNILLLAYTNKAVDEICRSVASIDEDLSFIRIGNESTCEEDFKKNLLKNLMRDCANRQQVRNLIAGNRIFISTVSTISRQTDLFRLKNFDVAIIDEASQIIEPQILGVLCAKGGDGKDAIRKFILIGDHKQLPAVVLQEDSAGKVKDSYLNEIGLENLRESFFERIYREEVKCGRTQFIDMLTKQGRMHPEIAEFPAKYFYNNNLVCVPLAHQQEATDAYTGDYDLRKIAERNRFCFLSVSKNDKLLSDKVNPQEASLVADIVREIIDINKEKDFDPVKQIGIITPYRNQIAMIKRELASREIQDSDNFVIDTVERFQGGQRDIMIYSCCVAREYQLQFLSNCMTENGVYIDRKLNVALTRARKQMFIVGDDELLSGDPVYRELINFTKEKSQFWKTPNK